ncbi:MAG: chromate efflux transporter [Gloeocapsa sp. DLM2.Bin57]|nr:MAG: chromate efflux transporter [Gloeocapsa sp. DLM2.Bin57]
MSASLKEIALVFGKLGVVGFGGPAAHIGMMEDEVINRKQWLDRGHFLDLVGATNLIPGPNSTEIAIMLGYVIRGYPGLIIAGVSFIFPAVLITGILAFIYQNFGSLPEINPLLTGIKPIVITIIINALWKLGKKALKSWQLVIIGLIVVGLVVWGVNEIIALLLGGIIGMFWLGRFSGTLFSSAMIFLLNTNPSTPADSPKLWQLGLFFLKIGSVLFGSGYVLVAFLEGELVNNYQWLTQQQLLDAIAIGQLTPGPVLSTATFIGYIILGVPGAIVATVGIFLPSFILVLLLKPIIPKLRNSRLTSGFLDAVNVSAVALMVVVIYRLGIATLSEPWGNFSFNLPGLGLIILSGFLLLRYKVSTPILVLMGGLLGIFIY